MRGFWYMLEAVLAGVIIIGFMLFVGYAASGRGGGPDVSRLGYRELVRLDDLGVLKAYAASGDFGNISKLVSVPGYSHSVEICDRNGNCVGERPEGMSVWVSGYITAGNDAYSPKTVKLYLWREE